jgi:hypothetical protein
MECRFLLPLHLLLWLELRVLATPSSGSTGSGCAPAAATGGAGLALAVGLLALVGGYAEPGNARQVRFLYKLARKPRQ